MTMYLMNTQIEQAIEGRLLGLLNRVSRAFGSGSALSLSETDEVCRWYVASLRGERGTQQGRHAAEKLLTEVIDPAEWQDLAAFWGTELGRCLGWWTGGHFSPTGGVSRTAAALMLGVGRQGVAKAVDNGRLIEQGETVARVAGTLLASSVRDEMRRRFPKEIQSGVPGVTPTMVGGNS